MAPATLQAGTFSARYRSLSGSLVDVEKLRKSNEHEYYSDEAPSLVSSRATSGSFAPMLAPSSSPKRRPTFAYHLPRRRFSRYFTLAISTLLLAFIYYLVQSARASQNVVQLSFKKPPPAPPAWEQFPFLKRYHGGIRSLVKRQDNKPEYPADEDIEVQRLKEEALVQKQRQDAETAQHSGFQKRAIPYAPIRFDALRNESGESGALKFEPRVKCYLDNRKKLEIPQLLSYEGVTRGFPDPTMGSYELLGLRNDVCFERYGRLGPYGYGYSERDGGSGAGIHEEIDGSEAVWSDGDEKVDYTNIRWAEVQDQCAAANAHRFRPRPKKESADDFSWMASGAWRGKSKDPTREATTTSNGLQFQNRTVVLIRTWVGYTYDQEDLFYLRALMNELSIMTGTEFIIHFLIHVKDDNLQIFADEEIYDRTLAEALPEEFRGMGTLWSERQMSLIYGGIAESFYRGLPVHGAYRSTYMPVQYFAHMHPEFDFFWHWEMDIRYTGHYYHLFDQVSRWAKQQPRKGLWERNGRFYIPAEHGSWEDFRQMTRVHIEHGTASKENIYAKLATDAGTNNPMDNESRRSEAPVWGPLRPSGAGDEVIDPENDPEPPTSYEKDKYEWGVGEEADFITFNPLFDPHGTNWILAEDVTGYNTSAGHPPRRAAIITASRLSRRLLETMHRETTLKRHSMFSEMWPGSCALHHGYKAVYAPHPVYIDRAWPTSYLAAIFNNGRNGASGGARTSVFSDERQHNFLGTSWYYHAGFGPNLWKRWLGQVVDNDGGEQWERENEGRMCLPAMLLHPVKQVDLVLERLEDEL